MTKHIKTVILFLLLSMMLCTTCFAKVFRSNDGRFSFTTPDNWYYTRVGDGDEVTAEVLSVASDAATIVTLKKSRINYSYKTFRECSYSEKALIRDNAIRQMTNYLRPQGFDVRVNRADIFDEAITIAYHIFKGGRRYYALQNYVMKNYILYSLSMTASDATGPDASGVVASLTADGLPFAQWAK